MKVKCPNCLRQREFQAFRSGQPICVYCEQKMEAKNSRKKFAYHYEKTGFGRFKKIEDSEWLIPKGRPALRIDKKDLIKFISRGGSLEQLQWQFIRQKGQCTRCRKILTIARINSSTRFIVRGLCCPDCYKHSPKKAKKTKEKTTIQHMWSQADPLLRSMLSQSETFCKEIYPKQ